MIPAGIVLTVQRPLKAGRDFRSFEKPVLPELNKRGIAAWA